MKIYQTVFGLTGLTFAVENGFVFRHGCNIIIMLLISGQPFTQI